MRKVNKEVKLPPGYHADWAGEYESQERSQARLMIVLPITILVICLILGSASAAFRSAHRTRADRRSARAKGPPE